MNENLQRAMDLGFTRDEILDRLLGRPTCAQDEVAAEASGLVGRVCVCRTRNAGVHVGKVLSVTVLPGGHAHVVLDGSHRLWSWTIDGVGVGMSGVANHGLKDGRVERTPQRVELFEVCEAIECSAPAWQKIQARAQ